jgi:hypothetical protein
VMMMLFNWNPNRGLGSTREPPDMAGPTVPGFGGKPELENGRRWKTAGTGRRPMGGLWLKMENDGDGDGSRRWGTSSEPEE